MPTKKPNLKTAGGKRTAVFSFDMYSGAKKMTVRDLLRRERPDSIQAEQRQARSWVEENLFIEEVQLLKTAFFNSELTFSADSPANQKKLTKWLEAGDGINDRKLRRFIDNVWKEQIAIDSVVSMWRNKELPWLLQPEDCTYSNAMGIEKLKARLGWSREMLTGAGADGESLTAKDIERYSKPEITLREPDEYFRVLTRAYDYRGFGSPRMKRVFLPLSQMESMQVGESQLAHGGRMVMRFHQLGFEARSATAAMKQTEFLWSKKRSDEIIKFLRGRQGFVEITGGFDHKISYVWVDPKLYDSTKWATVIERLIWWAGPIGVLIMAQQMPEHIFEMFKMECMAERDTVGRYLTEVINQSGALPVKVRIKWGSKWFISSKLAWDMAKALMTQGPLSLHSALGMAGFDPDEERRLKMEEAAMDKANHLPVFDPAHGKRPNDPAGRPQGAKDGDGNSNGNGK